MKNNIFPAFLLLILIFSCKKNEINLDLEYNDKVPNIGQVVNIEHALINNVKLVKRYLIPYSNDSLDNYAYPEISSLNDSTLIMIAKSSKSNIVDNGKASLIQLLSSNKGLTWQKSLDFSKSFPKAINSSMPSLVRINKNKVLLIYLIKYSNKRIDLKVEVSNDNCKTWGSPITIGGENVGYQIINNSRAIKIGKRILIPVSIPDKGNMSTYRVGNSKLSVFCYYSDDEGLTWNKTKAIRTDKYDLLEPGIVSVGGNEILMNIRTDIGKVLFARSFDLGLNWQFEESNIESPSSPQTIVKIPNSNNLVMVWNDNNKNVSIHGGNRSPLSLAVSSNSGKNWKKLLNIESEDRSKKDYSYSAIQFDEEYIYIVYNERDNLTGKFAVKMTRLLINDITSGLN